MNIDLFLKLASVKHLKRLEVHDSDYGYTNVDVLAGKEPVGGGSFNNGAKKIHIYDLIFFGDLADMVRDYIPLSEEMVIGCGTVGLVVKPRYYEFPK